MDDFRKQRGKFRSYPQKEWMWNPDIMEMEFIDRKMYSSSCMFCLRPGCESLTNLGTEKNPIWCCNNCLKDARKRI